MELISCEPAHSPRRTVNKQSLVRGLRHVCLQVTLMTQSSAFRMPAAFAGFDTGLDISHVTLPAAHVRFQQHFEPLGSLHYDSDSISGC